MSETKKKTELLSGEPSEFVENCIILSPTLEADNYIFARVMEMTLFDGESETELGNVKTYLSSQYEILKIQFEEWFDYLNDLGASGKLEDDPSEVVREVLPELTREAAKLRTEVQNIFSETHDLFDEYFSLDSDSAIVDEFAQFEADCVQVIRDLSFYYSNGSRNIVKKFELDDRQQEAYERLISGAKSTDVVSVIHKREELIEHMDKISHMMRDIRPEMDSVLERKNSVSQKIDILDEEIERTEDSVGESFYEKLNVLESQHNLIMAAIEKNNLKQIEQYMEELEEERKVRKLEGILDDLDHQCSQIKSRISRYTVNEPFTKKLDYGNEHPKIQVLKNEKEKISGEFSKFDSEIDKIESKLYENGRRIAEAVTEYTRLLRKRGS